MNEPLISVIVPVYNVEKYLPQCLDSIKNQTYTNLEIILVDDGSTDSSGIICDNAATKDKRIKVIHKENMGISHTRNIGIQNSSAELISFIDSDDYVNENYIQYLYNLLNKSKSDIAIGAHIIEYNSGNLHYKGIGKDLEESYSPNQVLQEILLDKNVDISVWGKLFYKSLFNNIEFPVGKKFEEPATIYKVIENAKRMKAIVQIPFTKHKL